ncbi:flavin reductase family protein [Salipiger mangrovisoli]|uniref:Flavin reductase family protein n=1 Tax=Salipiger mangrovisoli TaxID=2865933 RepID=A0ABR9X0A2_9RHOB|nr:flavin reductase family protein [Salipiger mangrovisoli]MBE9636966.1 flavin reductase family protein [Salipiger mangrovisoli]
MHYGDTRPESLTFDPFKAIIAPRPIGWIGTRNADGVPNLGPYSYFNAIGNSPHMICFTSDGLKHSVVNARDRGEFTFSLATEALAEAMNISSEAMPDGENEFAKAGLALGTSIATNAPFVADSPAALECVTLSVTELTESVTPINRFMVIGQVVQTHIRDEYITGGRFDTVKARPIARMGYRDYATVTDAWELMRPGD